MSAMDKTLSKKESAETLARKAVQIHILATNLAEQLVCEVESNVELKVLFCFGTKGSVRKEISNNEYVMVEE